MKLSLAKLVPWLITGAAIALVCLLQVAVAVLPGFRMVERLEWMSYDWRVRLAYASPKTVSTNLGFVYIGDDAISIFSEGKLGRELQFGLYWPRHVYGRLIRELKAQGAQAVALDLLFGERRADHPPVPTANGPVDSDRYFARELKSAGQVFLGATREVVPHPLFRRNSGGIGDISVERDSDGVLRRVEAFHDYRIWHPDIAMEARLGNWDLSRTQLKSNQIVFRLPQGQTLALALTRDGLFDPSDLDPQNKPANGFVRLQPAYEDVRVWHLGLILAASALGLDLEKARYDRGRQEIVFPGTNGVSRVLPVDRQGRFLIDWSVRQKDSTLTTEAFESLIASDIQRQMGTNVTDRFRGKLVVLGSVASGNELSDRGATPIEKDTFLTSNHWNVVNSMLMGRFIRQTSTAQTLLLIGLMGVVTARLSLRLRVLGASAAVALLCFGFVAVGLILFLRYRYWIPFITPLGTVLLVHFSLVSYQTLSEQTEKRRIKNLFSKIVSPNVVQELIKAEDLSLVGARRQVSILFADVRGFTEMTDLMQAKVEERIQCARLSPLEAAAYSDARAQEVLETVNLYLGTIADLVKKHEGTLDKYIGDCVMAFWGAPTPHEKHALACVHAAIDAQRAIHNLNQQRALENQRREQENLARLACGEEPLSLLHLLSLGTGINSGLVTVGLMGSESHIQNYTVFGREVNLAARLEPISGSGHILVGEATYKELVRDAPALAAICLAWEPTRLKGFQTPVKMYEVPWRTLANCPEYANGAPLRLETPVAGPTPVPVASVA